MFKLRNNMKVSIYMNTKINKKNTVNIQVEISMWLHTLVSVIERNETML